MRILPPAPCGAWAPPRRRGGRRSSSAASEGFLVRCSLRTFAPDLRLLGGHLKGLMRISIEAKALGKRDDGRLYGAARDMDSIAQSGHDALVPGQKHGRQL